MSNKSIILVVSGPSGSGKSSIVKEFLKYDGSFDVSISHTTRQMRHNEVNGKDYYFVSKQQFEDMVKRNEFVEWAVVHGNFYGTSRGEIERITALERNVLLEIDIEGAKNVKQIYGNSVITVFVITECFQVLKERLSSRGTDAEEVILKRIYNAKQEIDNISFYDYVIINKSGYLNEAVSNLSYICKAEKLRTERVWGYYNKIFWR